MNFYDFKAVKMNGEEVSMKEYEGKVVLIVNTASKCGFTPQLEGLESMYKKYKDRDFVVLGFPCNQFGKQDPGNNKEISEFCLINYGVTFPMFQKVEVNGDKAHPLFKFLKNEAPGVIGNNIKWNFTKFLVDKDGSIINRYASAKKPESIERDIENYL